MKRKIIFIFSLEKDFKFTLNVLLLVEEDEEEKKKKPRKRLTATSAHLRHFIATQDQ